VLNLGTWKIYDAAFEWTIERDALQWPIEREASDRSSFAKGVVGPWMARGRLPADSPGLMATCREAHLAGGV